MEGVTDAPMREIMGRLAPFDFAVTEFLRVSGEVLPAKMFKREVPEILEGSLTRSKLPVQVQLLGGNPERLGESARIAVDLGATAIDLNFGCPAPTVNRHDGGASLLRFPERIEQIVAGVRAAIPSQIPVSAKLRLGWDSIDPIVENVKRAEAGGASWLTIHARTRMQGYAPPVFWKKIGEAVDAVKIPVIANGDILTLQDARECRMYARTRSLMLGRGALRDPALVQAIRDDRDHYVSPFDQLENWLPLFQEFAEHSLKFTDGDVYTLKRLKQWMKYVVRERSVDWFEHTKRVGSIAEFFEKVEWRIAAGENTTTTADVSSIAPAV